MAASNEYTEYHLTPIGWVAGTEKTDFAYSPQDRPIDAVKTVEVKDFLSSPFSKPVHTRTTLWQSDNITLVSDLEAKFGQAPDYA